jgi:aldehyde dehydrogenase (NAD+)
MSVASGMRSPVRNPDRIFIDGEWVKPSSDAMIDVIDSNNEELYFRICEARAADIDRAVTAARAAFDHGPWPQLTHAQRAEYLRALAVQLRTRVDALADILPRESGILARSARAGSANAGSILDYYADLAENYPWEEVAQPNERGRFGMIVHEPVGVVGAIVPWNGPLSLALYKLGPALLAGCTVVLKASPEAPGAAYIIAEAAETVGLPAGVLNVLTADREVSERLVRDPRIDKIAFTGSTAAGRRIASIMAERIGRYSLELGGKSAAVVLDDADLATAAASIAAATTANQRCSLTSIIPPRTHVRRTSARS